MTRNNILFLKLLYQKNGYILYLALTLHNYFLSVILFLFISNSFLFIIEFIPIYSILVNETQLYTVISHILVVSSLQPFEERAAMNINVDLMLLYLQGIPT